MYIDDYRIRQHGLSFFYNILVIKHKATLLK